MLRGEKMMRVTEDGRWGHRAWFAPCLIVGLLTMAVACPSVAEAAEGGGTDLDMPLRVLVAPSPPPPHPDPPPPPPSFDPPQEQGVVSKPMGETVGKWGVQAKPLTKTGDSFPVSAAVALLSAVLCALAALALAGCKRVLQARKTGMCMRR